MLDHLLETHNEIDPGQSTARFPHDIVTMVGNFMRTGVRTTDKSIVDRDVVTIELFQLYLLHANVTIKNLTGVVRTLYEAAMLHQLMHRWGYRGASNIEIRTANVLKFMCIDKLTRLFLNLDPQDHDLVFSLAASPLYGQHAVSWQKFCTRSQAPARAITLFAKIDDCFLYFPTIFEKYELGIDFIAIHEDKDGNLKDFCVHVDPNANTCPQTRIVYAKIHSDNENPWVNRISIGVQQMNTLYPNYHFHGCKITQETNSGPITQKEIALIDSFLTHNLSAAANDDRADAA